jgi:tetratricopeptide (TPR) repeat protein
MRLSTKLLLTAAAFIAGGAGIYAFAYHLYPPPSIRDRQAAAPAPAQPPPPATPLSDQAVAQLYDECVRGAWPTVKDAHVRAAACSKALQTRRLKPPEIALARLTRGIARTALGDKVLAAEDYAEALKHYDGAVDPRNPDSLNLYRRATSLHAMGETDRALSDYGDAIRVDPGNSLAYLGRGVLLATRKRAYNRAIEDFDKVLVLQPDNVDALIARGNAYSQIGDNGRALADLDRAIQLAPDNPQAYVIRGLANNRRGQKQLAMQDYETALKIAPRYPQALANRAALLSEEGRYDQAISDLDESIKADSDNPVAYYNRGYAHFARHEYDKALADYDAAIKLEPGMGRAYNNRCLIRAITGKDLVAGLQDCDTAQKLMPLNLDVRDTRGFIYLKLGDPRLAVKEYNDALDVDPNRPLALYGRGIARLMIGETREGEGDKAAAVTLDPEVARQFAPFGLK